MRTEEAIYDLSEIRQRLRLIDARASFRCVSLLLSSCVFVAAGFLKGTVRTEQPESVFQNIATEWIVLFAAAGLVICLEVGFRSFSGRSRVTWNWCRQIAGAVGPVIAAAILVTWASLASQDSIARLPGLWAVLGGLALAVCNRSLPRTCQLVSVWWVVGGAVALRFAESMAAQMNLVMAVLMGGGQFLLAICLFAGVARDNQTFGRGE